MAKKKTNLTPSPLMALSMLALFSMMPVMFSLANNQKTTYRQSYAKAEATPSPTPIAIEINQ